MTSAFRALALAVLVGLLALAAFARPPREAAGGGAVVIDRAWAAAPLTSPAKVYLPALRKHDPWIDRVAARTMALGGSMNRWDWEAGIALAGLMHAYEETQDEEILDYVEAWTQARLAEPGTAERCRPPGAEAGHPNHATPAWAVLLLYGYRPRPEYAAVVDRCVGYLADEAPRVDGTLAHAPDQLWDDTLIVAVPLLARYGATFGRAELVDLAADEVLAHARRLQDPASGLWYHGWTAADPARPHMSGARWARGNGWAALATTELLRFLPTDHPQRTAVINALDRQLNGLAAVQDEGGLWHTVVDRPDFYLETSGSAGIGAAILRATEYGWVLGGGLEARGVLARAAVRAKVAADGAVTGVSAGTGVAPTIETYNTIRTDLVQPYGQGLYLLMATAGRG